MDIYDKYTEQELYGMYDEMLDDVYGMVDICGYSYDASTALERIDPTAYEVGFSDYCSMLEEDEED